MHREIMGLKHGDENEADHKSGNTLDNRRANLRLANNMQQNWNRRTRKDNQLGCKGIRFDKRTSKYVSRITANGVVYNLGSFDTLEEANRIRNTKVEELHGDFGRLEKIVK